VLFLAFENSDVLPFASVAVVVTPRTLPGWRPLNAPLNVNVPASVGRHR